jgi:hypothetical protein
MILTACPGITERMASAHCSTMVAYSASSDTRMYVFRQAVPCQP